MLLRSILRSKIKMFYRVSVILGLVAIQTAFSGESRSTASLLGERPLISSHPDIYGNINMNYDGVLVDCQSKQSTGEDIGEAHNRRDRFNKDAARGRTARR